MEREIKLIYEKLKGQLSQALKGSSELEATLKNLQLLYEGNFRNPVTKAPDGRQRDLDLQTIINRERRKPVQEEAQNHFYVAMLDIDNFGQFNKKYGEEIGNRILQGTTKILEETLRTNDFVGKLSNEKYSYHLHGEEKLVIFACRSDEDALNVAERIRKAVEERSENGFGYKVTESIGLTRWNPLTEDYQVAQNQADLNMQEAKKQGKNKVYFKLKD